MEVFMAFTLDDLYSNPSLLKQYKSFQDVAVHCSICNSVYNKTKKSLSQSMWAGYKTLYCSHECQSLSKKTSNVKTCPACGVVFDKNTTTCSYSCSNKHFRTGPNHGNWKENSYRTTCFHYHSKACVVCGESNIVEVHHLDENHHNNKPDNLIPLCPTHHQYWHSQFKEHVKQIIMDYVSEWKVNNCATLRD